MDRKIYAIHPEGGQRTICRQVLPWRKGRVTHEVHRRLWGGAGPIYKGCGRYWISSRSGELLEKRGPGGGEQENPSGREKGHIGTPPARIHKGSGLTQKEGGPGPIYEAPRKEEPSGVTQPSKHCRIYLLLERQSTSRLVRLYASKREARVLNTIPRKRWQKPYPKNFSGETILGYPRQEPLSTLRRGHRRGSGKYFNSN